MYCFRVFRKQPLKCCRAASIFINSVSVMMISINNYKSSSYVLKEMRSGCAAELMRWCGKQFLSVGCF